MDKDARACTALAAVPPNLGVGFSLVLATRFQVITRTANELGVRRVAQRAAHLVGNGYRLGILAWSASTLTT